MRGVIPQHRKKQKYHRTVRESGTFTSWGLFYRGANSSAGATVTARNDDTGSERKPPEVWTPRLPRPGVAHFITDVIDYATSTYKIQGQTVPFSGASLAKGTARIMLQLNQINRGSGEGGLGH